MVERTTTRSRPASYLVDAIVVALALARAFLPVPAYSGHVLFCTFAALSSRGVTLRLTSLLVLAEVLAIKLFLWRDLVTPVGGLAIALVTATIHRLARRDTREAVAS